MKILDIGDSMVATMAGGAADCQFWTRTVAKYCTLYQLREKRQITVSAASKYFANVLYGYRGQGLSVVSVAFFHYDLVGSMIAGYDKRGPQIFKLQVCSVGSGSLNAYGILDTHYKQKMTDEEARKLGRRAIMHATYRDSGSGGVCNSSFNRFYNSMVSIVFSREEFFQWYYLSTPSGSCSSVKHGESSDSDDDSEMLDQKKELSEAGKQLKKKLKQRSEHFNDSFLTIPKLTEKRSEFIKKSPLNSSVLTGLSDKVKNTVAPSVFDKYFAIKINGNDYVLWKLHDLKDCQERPVKLLLFGECMKQHWKLQVGVCVALMTPELADQSTTTNSKAKSNSFKPTQVVELGYSPDFGMCKVYISLLYPIIFSNFF
uniref:proteasome endopeptidase complex n=1 Tax=Heterorhabditis bacteriophora TaxID=37862 RepID=A0A1I7WTJ5_HETBA